MQVELYDAHSSRQLDRIYCQTKAPASLLMMRAASAVFDKLQGFDAGGKIWCLAGAGNNGGDAYGVAILALLKQRAVSLLSCGAALDPLHPVSVFAKELGLDTQADLPDLKQISPGDIIVDGLLGIGFNRPPEGISKRPLNGSIRPVKKARM